MRSMTGFGEGAGESGSLRVVATVRTVNHRFLDVAIRQPDELRPLEPRVRALVKRSVHRGRVDLRIEVEPLGDHGVEVDVDRVAVRALAETVEKLASEGSVAGGVRFGDLVQLRDVVRVRAGSRAWIERETDLVLEVVGAALSELEAGRSREGGELLPALRRALGVLREIHSELSAIGEELRQSLLATLRARLAEMLEGDVAEDRLAQEVAILADKADVQEELDRLLVHLDAFEATLEAEGAVGRRMDFLAQEILRERNTVASKCRDANVASRIVDAKVACEQLREQVQNVE